MQAVFDRVFTKKVQVAAELTSDHVEGWDSLKQVALVIALEKAFAIELDLEDLEDCKNVGEMADVIAKRTAKTGG
ncbi:MAG: acyl carrier protein [Deltaproteobacteria bacterium]|nr:acyl carrier protein [Deltaproteobacteria bacterium]